MSKSELHTILSSVQMSPVDRKRLVNYLNNFKNNQQQGIDEFVIKYNDDGTIDTNFDDIKAAVLNQNTIVIETNGSIINCIVVNANENTIEVLTDIMLLLEEGSTEVYSIGFGAIKFIFTKDNINKVQHTQMFIVNGNGNKFLSNDGTYHAISINNINGLSDRLQSIENRIKALEDAANA